MAHPRFQKSLMPLSTTTNRLCEALERELFYLVAGGVLENAGDDPSCNARGPISKNSLILNRSTAKDHYDSGIPAFMRHMSGREQKKKEQEIAHFQPYSRFQEGASRFA